MIRTRFAPSPTGYLHIGGVRTALFNWLLARQGGGQFILRIDDTDRVRNVEAALGPILEGFRWLGIDWDEGPEVGGDYGPYFQSERAEKYHAAAEKLIQAGHAYRDYARTEEIQAEREAAQQAGRSFVYSRAWMAESDADRNRFEAEGRTAVVRLKMPHEGSLAIDDLVRGQVQFDWAREQDHVIQRADGSCLYHLASVVDDHEMAISHVVRAEEHLSNTPRQVFIAQSLGYELPTYAHLPYVAEPGSRNKLSKRKLDKYLKNREFAKVHKHGLAIARRMGLETSDETFNPVIVDFYEQVGYLPDAVINYLLLLGWSLDDKTEFFSRDEMIEKFSLARVNKAPASFDPQKLTAFQDRSMRQLPIKRKVALMVPYLQRAGLVSSPPPCETAEQVGRIVEAAGDRIVVAGDILEYADSFVADEELPYDDQAFDKRLGDAAAVDRLTNFAARLAEVEPFDPPTLEAALRLFVEEEQIKIGEIIHALRVAVTGKSVGYGMFDALAILGRQRSLGRIERAIERARDRMEA